VLTLFCHPGGHKAAISNPNVSEEAKEHSREVLKDLEGKNSTSGGSSEGGGAGKQTSTSGGTTFDGKDAGNVYVMSHLPSLTWYTNH
jgi:hypothetical protein